MKTRVVAIVCFLLVTLGVAAVSIKKDGSILMNRDGYTKAQMAQFIAVATEDKKALKKQEIDLSYSDITNKDWYARYACYALAHHYMVAKSDAVFGADELFSYKDAGVLITELGIDTKEISFSLHSRRGMKAEDVHSLLKIIKKDAAQQFLKHKKAMLYKIADNQLITSAGEFTVDGYELSSYVGTCISFYTQGTRFAAFVEKSNQKIILPNVWCVTSDRNSITIYARGTQVKMKADFSDGVEYHDMLADITIQDQMIQSVQEKKDLISGKVLSIKENVIEIEGYGEIPMKKDAPIYRVFGEVKTEDSINVLLGYDTVTFVKEADAIIAALLTVDERVQSIRVLINTSNYASLFHDKVTVTCNQDFSVGDGDKEHTCKAGDVITIDVDSKYLKNGRAKVKPANSDGMVTLLNVERAYGSPSYHGSIEVATCADGLYVINETGLEQYLYAVVPSEMPVSYGAEALKVQAICARSFAYANILDTKYGVYGAHVEDSVKSQVYNNVKECKESIAAVDETCGEVLYAGESVANTYFYSTSCGSTADVADVWDSASTPAYLSGSLQAKETQNLDLSSEAAFQDFIDHTDAFDFFEKGIPWFRWNVTLTKDDMQYAVDNKLLSVSKNVKVKTQSGKYVQSDISSVGAIKDIVVSKRGKSGVVKQIIIYGEDNTIQIDSEYAIRVVLGNETVPLTLCDGSRNAQRYLPSGFFYLDKSYDENGIATQYTIVGGGFGHGVGMSQNGVKAMNDRGYSAEDILSHYYPHTDLLNVY